MFDHVQIKVADLAKSRPFYEAVLGTLGYKHVFEIEGVVVGFGTNPHDMLEISQAKDDMPPSKSVHIALAAKSTQAVKDFYEAALAHGATYNGAPGLREYEPGYFAAFVIDPNGNDLEAVYTEAPK
jgi:catechol 2,3-dioxygenase-like lactoylglutathione lyase family enzyme